MVEQAKKHDLSALEQNIDNAVTQGNIPEAEVQTHSNLPSSYTEERGMLSEISSSEPVVAEEVEQRESSHSQSDYLKWYLFGGLVLGGGAFALSGGGRKGDGSNVATHSHQTKDNVQSPASQIDKGQTQPTKDNVQSSASKIDKVQMGQSQSDKLQVDKPADSAEKEVLEKPEVEQKPILIKSYQYDDSMFKNDTDKDGLFDALDPNPTMWNVSERDLRTFTTLSYKDEKELNAIFTNKNLKAWQEINLDKKSGLNNTFSEKESEDFIQNWALIEFKNTSDFLGSGLDYSVFGNGKKPDGSYQQIVLAFRGSKGSYTNLQDWYADLKVLRGDLPTQAKELVGKTKAIVDKYSPDTVYATGHSLGGYLTQYFTAYAMQESAAFQAKMKHSAIFNPLLLLTDKGSNLSLIKARENTDRFVKEAISNDDVMSGNFLYKTNSYIINGEFLADGGVPRDKAKEAGIIGGGVAGTIVGGLLALVTGGASLAAGALLGGSLGALKGNSLANEVLEKLEKEGLGTYDNTVRFEPLKKDWIESHSMIRFYEKTDDLVKHFSFGGRHDKWEEGENAYMKDSDKDGIADIVELHFHSDPNDANSRLAQSKLLINGRETQEVMPVVVYHLADKQDFSSTSQAKIEHIYGNDGDNRLDGGSGTNVLFGGKGKDIFVLGNNDFKHQELNIIGDFNAAEDKLDLSVLDLKGDFAGLFSNEPNGNTAISWSKDTQTLNYQVNNQTFVLAQFLNKTELSVENFIV